MSRHIVVRHSIKKYGVLKPFFMKSDKKPYFLYGISHDSQKLFHSTKKLLGRLD